MIGPVSLYVFLLCTFVQRWDNILTEGGEIIEVAGNLRTVIEKFERGHIARDVGMGQVDFPGGGGFTQWGPVVRTRGIGEKSAGNLVDHGRDAKTMSIGFTNYEFCGQLHYPNQQPGAQSTGPTLCYNNIVMIVASFTQVPGQRRPNPDQPINPNCNIHRNFFLKEEGWQNSEWNEPITRQANQHLIGRICQIYMDIFRSAFQGLPHRIAKDKYDLTQVVMQ